MNKGMRASDDTWRVWVCFYLSLICGMLVLASTHELYFRRLYDENNWLLYAAASVVVSSIVYMHVCFSSHNPLHLRLGIFVFTGGSAWLCLVLYSWPFAVSAVPISCVVFVLCIFLISSVLEFAYGGNGEDCYDAAPVSLPHSKAHVQGIVNSLIFATISVMVCWGLLLVINDDNVWVSPPITPNPAFFVLTIPLVINDDNVWVSPPITPNPAFFVLTIPLVINDDNVWVSPPITPNPAFFSGAGLELPEGHVCFHLRDMVSAAVLSLWCICRVVC